MAVVRPQRQPPSVSRRAAPSDWGASVPRQRRAIAVADSPAAAPTLVKAAEQLQTELEAEQLICNLLRTNRDIPFIFYYHNAPTF